MLQTGLTAMHTASQFGQQEFVRQMLVKVPATITTEPPRSDTNNPLLSVNSEVRWFNRCSWISFIFRKRLPCCDVARVERARLQEFQKGLASLSSHRVSLPTGLTSMSPRALHALHTLLLRYVCGGMWKAESFPRRSYFKVERVGTPIPSLKSFRNARERCAYC